MAKNMAKRNLICFAILAALIIALCFVNVMVPATNSRFVGFVNAITTDIDVSGGVAGNYDITMGDKAEDKEKEFHQSISTLKNKLIAFGYDSVNINVEEQNSMYIEMPNIKSASDILYTALNKEGTLRITTASSTDSWDDEKDVLPAHVVDVSSMFAQTNLSDYAWGVNISFTQDGKNRLKELTASASDSTYIYIYIGEKQINQIGPISNQIDQDYLFFHGQKSTVDETNASALNILLGKYDVNFSLKNGEIVEIAPTMGQNSTLIIWIALAVISIAIIALMFVMYGELGYIFALMYAFFMGLLAFFMQAVPIYSLAFSGVLALIIGIIMFFVTNFAIYNSAKKGCAEGKKIPLAIKLGISNNVMKIVDVTVVTIIACVVMYIFGGVFVKSFALTLAMCAALNIFISILFNKLFTKWYVTINSKNYEKLHFVKGEHVDGTNN